jgi:hypothetical protein
MLLLDPGSYHLLLSFVSFLSIHVFLFSISHMPLSFSFHHIIPAYDCPLYPIFIDKSCSFQHYVFFSRNSTTVLIPCFIRWILRCRDVTLSAESQRRD